MLQVIQSLSAPLFSLVLLIIGSGLFNTFLSIRMETEGFKIQTIGFVISSLYIGILIGSFRLDHWIAKTGYIRSFIIFSWGSMLLVLAQAMWIHPIYWSLLRLLCGVCMAGIFIVIESWILLQSPSSMRGAMLSLYLAVFYAALSCGQFLINLLDHQTNSAFYITACLFAVSPLPLVFQKNAVPKIESSIRLQLVQLFRLSPLGFLGSAISGMLLAAIYGLVPVYAQEIGLGIPKISALMGIIIFGGFVFQWPIGRLADRGGRRRVLKMTALMTALLSIAIALINPESIWLLFLLGWFFGGFSFTIYPLSMAYACDKVDNHQLVSMTGALVLAYGIGAISGPLAAPFMMSFLGMPGLFYFFAIISFSMTITR